MSGFRFARPQNIEEAHQLFNEAPGQTVYLAGGTDLLVKYRKGEITPELVISLTGLPGLDQVSQAGDMIVIGGLARLEDIRLAPLVASRLPVLADALNNMASVQIRNAATMAGNIMNAAPSADTAPPLLVLDARLVLEGPEGERRGMIEDFFLGPGQAAARPGEILTAFEIPVPPFPSGGAYAKVSRRKAMDLALLGVAVQIEFEADIETCRQARIALGVAGPTPLRARQAEASLKGRVIDQESLDRAGRLAVGESFCRDSLRGQAWYRQEMIRVYVRRMGLKAQERARAGEGR
ncbi:MAG: FAD binding domain-containing protein [Deltaproteobacteria bacterium]|nr:FAD binding domain-containing protein [Deltaproteobacteria bacterium]